MIQDLDSTLQSARRHYDAGDLAQAEAICRNLLRDHPKDPAIIRLFGLIALEMGDRPAACQILSRAAALAPNDAAILIDLARALIAVNEPEKAAGACSAALRLEPQNPLAHFQLGNALRDFDRLEDAAEAYRLAIQLKPELVDAYGILARTLTMLARFNDALAVCRRSVEIAPNSADAVSDVGTVLKDQGKYAAAVEAYDKALAIDPNHAEAHARRATILLQQGNFSQGWEEYEWRMRSRQFGSSRRGYVPPAWTAADLKGRNLLIHAEQGIGDTIQFLRYVNLIRDAGGQAMMIPPPTLVPLLKSSFGESLMIVEEGPTPPRIDFECPIMTLPRVFRTELASIPAIIPYIKPDPARLSAWRTRVDQTGGGMRVGLVWAGSPAHRQNRQRSMPFALFAPLAQVGGTRFYNLQKGPAAAEAAGPSPAVPMVDRMPQANDLTDTAALIAQLDLVIAVDTAVAHLAGAMGKPVWLLVHDVSDWRWMLERHDTPWYPTMQIFRQKTYGDWDEVMQRLAGRLAEFTAPPTSRPAAAGSTNPFSDSEIR